MNAVNGQVGELRAWEGYPAVLHIAGDSSDDQAYHHSADVAGPSAAVVASFAVVEGVELAAVLVDVVGYFALSSRSASVPVKEPNIRRGKS